MNPNSITQQERFAKLLQATQFTLQTFDDDCTRKDRALVRVIPSGDVNDPALAQLNDLGAGIFVTVNETDLKWRSNDNITRIRAVWQEDDDGFAGMFPIEPTFVVESSPGKFHRYWLVKDGWPADEQGRKEFEGVMARMVEQYGCDPNAVDLSRVLRLPGYFNKKRKKADDPTRLHEVRIVKVHPQLRRYTREEILKAFPSIYPTKAPPIVTEFAPSGADELRMRDALFAINADDREIWMRMGMAIKHELGEGGRALWDEWSATSDKFDRRDQERTWDSFKRNGVSAGTIFHEAKQAGWRDPADIAYERACNSLPPPRSEEMTPETRRSEGVKLDDFLAHLPTHSYIYKPTRDVCWPAASVNAKIPPIATRNGEMKASAWLDKHRAVEQATWAPGKPMEIKDQLIADGGWFDRPGSSVFNLYRPPSLVPQAGDATPWLEHVEGVFGADADHIVKYLAHRVQNPHDKVNHALVLGGNQGIGKDTLLEPVKHAIGPWNFAEASPQQMLGQFNGFLKSVILRISEARDLGEYDRFKFYDHMKTATAAPPDVLRVNEKFLREHYIVNVCGVVITTNHKSNGLYLPEDDRRHFVAWSALKRGDFSPQYWNGLWGWFEKGGIAYVADYLTRLDLSTFDAKAPPPKTEAFWEIVHASATPEDADMANALEQLGWPTVTTLKEIRGHADCGFLEWLNDRRNRRLIPHRLEQCGYVPVRNPATKDQMWVKDGDRQILYAKSELSNHDRHQAAMRACGQR
jgi:hypothetical protein